jgi:hypothetical protein
VRCWGLAESKSPLLTKAARNGAPGCDEISDVEI